MHSPTTMHPPWTPSRFRRAAAWAAAGVLLLGACAEPRREPAGADFAADLVRGAAYAERLGGRPRAAHPALADREVIAAGYLERLRRGMGSPFRLMEYALLDPRLTPETRDPLAWALLEATRSGRGYELDPHAFTHMGTGGRGQDTVAARLHLALIEHAVGGAEDPRAGELAVRQAYRLATASHAVSAGAPALAAAAAALARDRVLARRDAARLLAAAERSGNHPFAVLVEWRRERRFEVEAPPGAPRSPFLEEAAAAQAVRLVERVEAVTGTPGPPPRPPSGRQDLPPLTEAAARKLAKLARAQSYPPVAPIWITVQRYDDELRRGAADDAAGRRAVERFLARARTEETIVAELALLGAASAPVRKAAARVATDAGVAMRAYAQERVWFPGFTAPSAMDLRRTFGLRKVEFEAGVPAAWRPYYRRMLGDALADLKVALPSADVRGAAFRIGATGREGALAIHDPHGRTINLPPRSGAGAIAHEVGHDLDWQVARARYRTRSAYGTEYAARRGHGNDRLATAVRRMPVPPEVPLRGGPEAQRRYAQRPPEIFARTFDGYVAAALAERGRSNGYLTSVQDDFLAGTGLALMPGALEDADPFMEMMMIVSPVPERARREFLARWGAGRVPSGLEVANRIAGGAGAPPALAARRAPGMRELLAAGGRVRAEAAAVLALRDSALAQWNAARCANPFAAQGSRGEAAVSRLADAAASARIRGIVTARARALGLHPAPAWLHDVWLAAPPAAPDPLLPLAPSRRAPGAPQAVPACAGAAVDGPSAAGVPPAP